MFSKKFGIIIAIFLILMLLVSIIPVGTMNYNITQSNSKNTSIVSSSIIKNIYINNTFIINSSTIDPITGQKGFYGFDANVIIGSTGNLSVLNANVYFVQDSISPDSLKIMSGGSLYLYNSTFTVTPDRYYPSLNFTINDFGGTITTYNSKFMFPGWFNASNSYLYFYKTYFTNVTAGDINTINQFGFPASNDIWIMYGPTPVFSRDTIIMKNVYFNKLKQTPPNIVFAASGIPLNNRFPIIISSYKNETIANGFSLSPSNIYPYATFTNGTILLNYTTSAKYSNDSLINIFYKNVLLYSTTLSSATKYLLDQLPVSFSNLVYLASYSSLESPGNFFVNITGPSVGTVTVNSLKINLYSDKSLITQTGFYQHQFNLIGSTLYGQNVFVSANSNYSNGNPYKNYIFMQNSLAYILNLTVTSEAASGGYFDPPYLMDQSSSLYIYRYAIVKVINYNGVPLSNLTVTATPDNLPIISNGIPLIDNQMVNNLNSILYSNLNIALSSTNSSGIAVLPLFTDNVSLSFWPNSLYAGNYLINISAGNRLLKSTDIGLPVFPDLNLSGNDYLVNETVIVPDIDLESISVPQMMIHNETYQISSEMMVSGESLSNVPVQFSLPGLVKIVYANLIENKQTFVNISYSVPSNIVPGNYSAEITVNPYRTIYESNYSNDYRFSKVQIFPDTDIAVSKPTFSVIVLYSKEYVNFTISNYGTDPAKNVYVSLELLLPNSTLESSSWTLNVSGKSYIPISFTFVPTQIGSYSVIIRATYYWDINQSNNYNYNITSSKIVYQFVPSGTGFLLLGNITLGLPMNILLYSKINVTGIVSSMAPPVTVSFYDLTNGVYIGQNQTYYSNGYLYANITTNYFSYGHKYLVGLVLTNPYENSTYVVYEYYNFTLYVPSVSYLSDPLQSTYMNGTIVPIYINLTLGSVPINNLNIIINFTSLGIVHKWTFNTTSAYENISLVYYFNTSLANLNGKNMISVPYIIYITYPEIYPYNVILYQGQIKIVEKPNLYIQSFSYKLNSYVKSLDQVPLGTYFEIVAVIGNNGGSTAIGNATLTLKDNNNLILSKNITNLLPGYTFTIYDNITGSYAGSNTLTLFLNYSSLPQKSSGPRVSTLNFNVVSPATEVIMYSSTQSPVAGQKLTLTFLVLNINATQQQGRNVFVQNITLTIIMKGSSFSETYTLSIGTTGYGVLNIIPKNSGSYSILAEYTYIGQLRSQVVSSMNIQGQPFFLPIWLIIVIIIIIVVGGIFAYSFIRFKKVEKNLMVCGNCGSLIPADSDKCPVCGVVFEKENVKCGNCGSWIKKDAKYCPVCGTLYMDEKDPEYSKYSQLRENYLLDIQKFKEEAKRDLGDKFTDEEFYRWWNSKPEFITFEKWIEKKEEEKNPSVECPVCGTLNPKGSKFCKVCGSPLPSDGDEKK